MAGTQGKRQMRRKMPMKNKDRGEEMCLTRLQGAYTPEGAAGPLRSKLGREGRTPSQYPKGGPAPLRIPACQRHLIYRAIPGPSCSTPESVKSSLHLPSNVLCVRVSLMIRSPSPGKTARLTSKHVHLASTQHTLAKWVTPGAVKQSEIPNSAVTIA